MASAPETATSPVVRVSEAAQAVLLELRASEPEPDALALRLDVVGETGPEFAYELTFAPRTDAGPGDALEELGGLAVLVPADSLDKLQGATLDHAEATGLVLRNPNRPRPRLVPGGDRHLEGTVEERLHQLLDGEINPMLASHGGFAALERVEGETAYLSMGGGCQGCGLAALTLTEGIKSVIEEAIPEIARVEDVTDHAAGENPFYSPDSK